MSNQVKIIYLRESLTAEPPAVAELALGKVAAFFVGHWRERRTRGRRNPEPISAANAVTAALTPDFELNGLRVREQIELPQAESGVVGGGSV